MKRFRRHLFIGAVVAAALALAAVGVALDAGRKVRTVL
jgi:hypothetical protein